MAGRRAGAKKPRATSPRELNDEGAVRVGEAALQERFGTMGMRRFLRDAKERIPELKALIDRTG